MPPNDARLIVASELYYPEETSTGYFLTGIAEHAATELEVHVICAQPTYASRGSLAPKAEVRNGVHIERRGSTRFDKDVLPLRVLNALTISISLAIGVYRRARSTDQVLVVTTPPLLPFAVTCAAGMRGARVVLLVHDVYPEVLVAARMISKDGLAARMLAAATAWLYSRVDRLIVIGRDMAGVVGRSDHALAAKISIVPNWADVIPSEARELHVQIPRAVYPERSRGARDDSDFVVLYSGNIGRTHGMESLLAAAALLRDEPRIRFVISGWGAKRAMVEATVAASGLTNVMVRDPVPRDQLGAQLASASICVITLVPGMYGVSVPSRMYNIMAAGKPILAIADRDSEVWRVVEEENIGWTVAATESPDAIAAAIRKAAANPESVRDAGTRARAAAVARYSETQVLDAFLGVLRVPAQ